MKEIDIQRELVNEARGLGGYAIKMSNRFLVGIPDLLIKLPGMQACLIEVKIERMPTRDTGHIGVNPTPQQLRNLKMADKANFASGVLVCCSGIKAGMWNYVPVITRNVDLEHCNRAIFIRDCLTRVPGGKWHVEEIIRRLGA